VKRNQPTENRKNASAVGTSWNLKNRGSRNVNDGPAGGEQFKSDQRESKKESRGSLNAVLEATAKRRSRSMLNNVHN
jgi:hypothetical protein